ncbi:MAG: hypothetical protein KAU50_02670 [Candidatus Marinimicrobia bacterium]|nr:hypothetical protein [Candidatus Neomarinimicrobiota bacterium]
MTRVHFVSLSDVAIVTMSAVMMLLLGACEGQSGDLVSMDDLYGTWDGDTIAGQATLIFSARNNVNQFEFWAVEEDSSWSGIIDEGALLAKGRWGLDGQVIALVEEVVTAHSCVDILMDRYELLMDKSRSRMLLEPVGGNCDFRAQLLSSATWLLRSDEGS